MIHVHQAARIVRVYVTSSFGDMERERTGLQQYVLPRLRELCKRHGCRFQAIDLRRGLENEADFDQHMMRRCLEELRALDDAPLPPKFLVLLGDRYGLRPLPLVISLHEFEQIEKGVGEQPNRDLLRSSYLLDENAEPPVYVLRAGLDAGTHATLRDMLKSTVDKIGLPKEARLKYCASTTEREILKGALASQSAAANTWCFFRQIEDLHRSVSELSARPELRRYVDVDGLGRFNPLAHAEVAAIKEALAHRVAACHNYLARFSDTAMSADHVGTLPETLDECLALPETERGTLCADAWRALSTTIQREIAALDRAPQLDVEYSRHRALASELTRVFVGRRQNLNAIANYVAQPSGSLLVNFGLAGSGKSALMAAAVKSIREQHPQAQVVYRFLGTTAAASNVTALLRSLCQEICRRYGEDESTVGISMGEAVQEFPRRLALAHEEAPLVLLLDGLDALGDDPAAQDLKWLPETLPKHVHVIVSCLAHPSPFFYVLQSRVPLDHLIEVGPLATTECAELLSAWLKRAGRRLTSTQWSKVSGLLKGRGLPIQLRRFFAQTRWWHSFDDSPDLRTDASITFDLGLLAKLERVEEGSQPIDDRRSCPRVALEADITFASDSNFYTGFAEDISDGGVFVATYSLYRIGTAIQVTFTLPSGHTLTVDGTVRWLRDIWDLDHDTQPGMGIAFEGLNAEDKQTIARFMQSRAPLFFAED